VILRIVRSVAILLLTAACALTACAAGLISRTDRLPSGIMRWWAKGFIALGGWHVRVEGLGHLPPGGAILAANHQSLVDIPLLIAAIPRQVRFLAKQELGRVPVFGYAMRKAGNLFVDRDDARDALHLVRVAADRMERGQMMVIFPEGTRSRDGELGEFKPGAFYLARKIMCPLVPVVLEGGREALPPGTRFFRPARLAVRVLAPVTGDGGRPLSRDELAAETRKRILSAPSAKGRSSRKGAPV